MAAEVSFTPESVLRHRGWFVGVGIALITLGVFAVGMSAAMTIVTVLAFGVVLAIGGVVTAVHAFRERKDWGGFTLHLLAGLLYLVAGGYMVANPLVASLGLTLVVGVALLFSGFIRVVLALFAERFANRIPVVASGVLSILLGLVILAGWPISGLWVIGLFVAVELIMSGVGYVLLGLGARSARREPEPQPHLHEGATAT